MTPSRRRNNFSLSSGERCQAEVRLGVRASFLQTDFALGFGGGQTFLAFILPFKSFFPIGLDKSGKDIPDFEKLDKADRRTLALLKIAQSVGDANDAEIVAKVNAEVAEKEQHTENTKKSQAAGA